MASSAKTKSIPEWSANGSVNWPKDWQWAIGRKASALGISTGEMIRQLVFAGAKSLDLHLARELRAAHKRYYPMRQMLCGISLLLTLGAGSAGQFCLEHHHHDLRSTSCRVKIRQEWGSGEL